jgi:hypothetical protein
VNSTDAWEPVTTASFPVRLFDSAYFENPVPTTDQLSPGAGFVPGQLLDQANPAGPLTLTPADQTEHEWAVQIRTGAVAGAAYEFRVSDDGTVCETAGVNPRLVVAGQ